MSVLECFLAESFIAAQTSGSQSQSSTNSPLSSYFLLGILVAVMVLVVVMFIRVNARRSSSKR